MASSIRKAHSLLSCQLCDNPYVIKWKCNNCALLMCDNCKERVHPRFKSSETHTIISIKDVGRENKDILTQLESMQISKPAILSVSSTYTTSFKAVCKMQYSNNDTIFCSYNLARGSNFFICRLLKESVKVLQNLNIICIDFALDNNDNIYFGQYNGSELRVSSPDGVTKTILSTSPMVILGIHINNDNERILGLREQGSSFPVTEFCTRQIAVFGANNKRKLTIEYDQKGKKLFSYIWRISTDSEKDIYAIDQFENFDGRIVALKSTGSLKYIYKGHSSVNSPETPFEPMGLVITETNIIIISERVNHCFHALNTKGDLLRLQTVIGIEDPLCLCLDSERFLLVGCYHTGDRGAKLHVAKLEL